MNEEKFNNSAALYRQRLSEIAGQRRKIKMLAAEDEEVLLKGGKRLRVQSLALNVESQARMDIVQLSSEEEEETKPVCTYPKGRGAIRLYPEDMARLRKGMFLNDQIINLVLKWLYDHTLTEENKAQIHICDSFVYAGFMAGINRENLVQETRKVEANMDKVFRNPVEARGLGKNLVLIPVCEDSHWFLAVLVNEEAVTTVLVLDSWAQRPRDHVVEICRRLVARISGTQGIMSVKVEVVQQRNGYDCGVHLLHNAEMVLRHAKEHPRSELRILERYLRQPIATRPELLRKVINMNNTQPQQIRSKQQQPAIPQPHTNAPISPHQNPIPQPQNNIDQTTITYTYARQQQQQQPSPPQPQQVVLQQRLHQPPQPDTKQPKIATPAHQGKTPTVLTPEEGYTLQQQIRLINRSGKEWAIPGELIGMLTCITEEARVTLDRSQRRRVIFRRQMDSGTYRFQVTKTGGLSLVFKVGEE